MVATDERGLGRRIKSRLPSRALTVAYNSLMRLVPFRLKYSIGGLLRNNVAPYRLLKPDDTVVQIGNARDILCSGRNRAIHFARLVPQGRVIAIEADSASYQALHRVVKKYKLDNITVVHSGAWDKKTELVFLSSPDHPAANLIEEAQAIPEDLLKKRRYTKQVINVDTVDNILRQLNVKTPTLVSITTNGAELKVLEGLTETVVQGCPYISLAETGEGFIERMNDLGYEYLSRDDRGYCFGKKQETHLARDAA
jgi:FkbM family methyltransferase